MNFNPADVLNSVFNFSGRPDLGLRRLSLPRVRLAVSGGDCLGVGRRLAAAMVTGKIHHNQFRHHLYDATDESITTANRNHRCRPGAK